MFRYTCVPVTLSMDITKYATSTGLLRSDSLKLGFSASHPQDLTATLKRDHEAVNKDNNFIYNDLVPEFGTLEPPGKTTPSM